MLYECGFVSVLIIGVIDMDVDLLWVIYIILVNDDRYVGYMIICVMDY